MVSLIAITPLSVSAQISADSIADACHQDSGQPRDGYLEYGERLVRTLNAMSPAQLERVFGAPGVMVKEGGDSSDGASDDPPEVEVGDDLNEALELATIEFDLFSAKLPSSAKEPLGELADYLCENPDVTIQVEGHVSTDFHLAQALSEERAEAARDYLIGLGVISDRIETVGKGVTEPLVEGHLAGGNQRIELIVTAR